MRSVLFLTLLVLSVTSFSQIKYSKGDLAEIRNMRVQEKTAYKNTDRQLHYEVGAFFDKIYHKYLDTSMSAAIRNYTKSTESEGDLTDPGSRLAAFRLGEIYESGIRADTNYGKAMFYYLLSHELGTSRLDKLKAKACAEPAVLFASADSVVISFSPFCLRDPESFSFLLPMVEKLREGTGKNIAFGIRYPEAGIRNSYYGYYNRYEAPRRLREVISVYLEPYMSSDRLEYTIESNSYEGEVHIMTFIAKEPVR